jgi:HEAT repeat protein
MDLLSAPGSDCHLAVIETLKALGASALTAGLLDHAEGLLASDDRANLLTGAALLAALGGIRSDSPVPERLLTLLYRQDSGSAEAVAQVLGGVGARMRNPAFRKGLADIAVGSDRIARLNAVRAYRALGAARALGEDDEQMLLERVEDEDFEVRYAALGAVLELDLAHDDPDFGARLLRLFRAGKASRRAEVVELACRTDAAAPRRSLGPLLREALADSSTEVRRAALRGLAAHFPDAPDWLDRLPQLVCDDDRQVKLQALAQVQRLGPAAAQLDLLAALRSLLAARDDAVWPVLFHTLRALGPRAVQPALHARVGALLASPDAAARRDGADALRLLGRRFLTRELLRALLDRLDDESAPVRLAAARAVWRLVGRRRAARRRLSLSIGDPEKGVRGRALRARLLLGDAALTPAFLVRLGAALALAEDRVNRTALGQASRLPAEHFSAEIVAGLTCLHARGSAESAGALRLLTRRGYRLFRDDGDRWRAVVIGRET